jgi:hypothetical protein
MKLNSKSLKLNKNFNGTKIIIHSANVREPTIGESLMREPTFDELLDGLNIFHICLSISYHRGKILKDIEAKFKCSFDASLNENEFIPILVDYVCCIYIFLNEHINLFDDEKYFLIDYKDALYKENRFITQNFKECKERGLKVKRSFIKVGYRTLNTPAKGEVVTVGICKKEMVFKQSLFEKLFKRIKNAIFG